VVVPAKFGEKRPIRLDLNFPFEKNGKNGGEGRNQISDFSRARSSLLRSYCTCLLSHLYSSSTFYPLFSLAPTSSSTCSIRTPVYTTIKLVL
jgi:hypothetical protein